MVLQQRMATTAYTRNQGKCKQNVIFLDFETRADLLHYMKKFFLKSFLQ